jgi:hypothetical protein
VGGTGSVYCHVSRGIFSFAALVFVTRELVITKTDLTGIGCDVARYMKLAEDRCNCEPIY